MTLRMSYRLDGRRRLRLRAQRGFTAVEVVIVLMILALGTAVGVVAFRRAVVHARLAEATAMLNEMASKEQAFYAGGGRYLPLRGDGRVDLPSTDEAASAFYPQPADSQALSSVRTPTLADDPSLWPEAWRRLGIRPVKSALYCTYLANAGASGQELATLRFGSALFGAQGGPPPAGAWFYALAACNFDGRPGYPDDVTVLGLSSASGAVQTFNDGR